MYQAKLEILLSFFCKKEKKKKTLILLRKNSTTELTKKKSYFLIYNCFSFILRLICGLGALRLNGRLAGLFRKGWRCSDHFSSAIVIYYCWKKKEKRTWRQLSFGQLGATKHGLIAFEVSSPPFVLRNKSVVVLFQQLKTIFYPVWGLLWRSLRFKVYNSQPN